MGLIHGGGLLYTGFYGIFKHIWIIPISIDLIQKRSTSVAYFDRPKIMLIFDVSYFIRLLITEAATGYVL